MVIPDTVATKSRLTVTLIHLESERAADRSSQEHSDGAESSGIG